MASPTVKTYACDKGAVTESVIQRIFISPVSSLADATEVGMFLAQPGIEDRHAHAGARVELVPQVVSEQQLWHLRPSRMQPPAVPSE